MANYRIRIGAGTPNSFLVVAAQASYALTGQAVGLSYSAGFIDVPGPAGATSFTVTWTNPTNNADGTTLNPSITTQRIVYDTVSRTPLGGYAYVKYLSGSSGRTLTISGLASNTYYFAHQVYNGVTWSDISTEFSKASS